VEIQAQRIVTPWSAPEMLIEKGDIKIRIPLTMGSDELGMIMKGLGVTL